ncbi:MAG: GNAT family N-acetyltransferase [Bacteroidetes bacterium]|nr:GNAT family N-acetyltransferase [Bacteroidota bacterium]
MTIRPATRDDIPAIRTIAHAAWPVAYGTILTPAQLAYMLERMYSTAALTEQMTGQGHAFLLAEEHGTAFGFASFSVHYEGRPHTRLHKLYLLPRHKGTGAGKALLEHVAGAGQAAGDGILQLNVNRHNPSVGFYQRQGFAIVREEVLDIGSGYVMDDFVMERTLRGNSPRVPSGA